MSSIVFLGDWCSAPDYPFPTVSHSRLAEAMQRADVVVANLEAPVCSSQYSPIDKIGPHLAQDPNTPRALSALGISHVSLANNHIMDGGVASFDASIDSLNNAGIVSFGYVDTTPQAAITGLRAAWKIARVRVGGKTVSLVGVAEREFNVINGRFKQGTANGNADGRHVGACILDPIDLQQTIEEEKKRSRHVFLVVHGGVEYEFLPPPHLLKLCRWLIDAGASGVVTHHPHVPGFIEAYRDRPIAYLLGDFWMSGQSRQRTPWRNHGYALQLKLDDSTGAIDFEQIHYKIDYDRGVICLPRSSDRTEYRGLSAVNLETATNSGEYANWWKGVVGRKTDDYLRKYSAAYIPRRLWRSRVMRPLLRRRLEHVSSWAGIQLNGLQCASHSEIWKSVLDQAFDNSSDNSD